MNDNFLLTDKLNAPVRQAPDTESERANMSTVAWLKFIRDRRWSRRQKHELLVCFGSPEKINQASTANLRGSFTGRYRSSSTQLNERLISEDLAWLTRPEANFIHIGNEKYPQLLREIDDPPLALFTLGDISLFDQPSVAIVGSRRPTPIGVKVARELSASLSNLGIVVTSGMALGIDGLAHRSALEQSGSTIAVMGCGLDTIYPSRHKALFDAISQSGLIVSEYPLGAPASKYTFPERNRIVSGLSFGVVIVEAAERSGTLITARLAAEQNRQVMVVPGSYLSKQYEGSHQLIKTGAALVSNVEDVVFNLHSELSSIASFNMEEKQRAEQDKLTLDSTKEERLVSFENPEEAMVMRFLSSESTAVDALISSTGLTAAEVSAMLLMLELKGLVAVAGDGGYLSLA